MLLNILPAQNSPSKQRISPAQMSMVPRLRNSDLRSQNCELDSKGITWTPSHNSVFSTSELRWEFIEDTCYSYNWLYMGQEEAE